MIKNISTLSFKIYIGEHRKREVLSLSRSLSFSIYIYMQIKKLNLYTNKWVYMYLENLKLIVTYSLFRKFCTCQ